MVAGGKVIWGDRLAVQTQWLRNRIAVPDNEQVKHNRTFVEVDHPRAGKLTVTDIPFQMSKTPGAIRRPPPLIGEHGREILSELGYDAAAIEQLINAKTISIESV